MSGITPPRHDLGIFKHRGNTTLHTQWEAIDKLRYSDLVGRRVKERHKEF